MLEDELAKTNTLFKAPEPAERKAGRRTATAANLENENKNNEDNEDNNANMPSPLPALLTRLATTKAEEKAHKKAERGSQGNRTLIRKFEIKLLKALEDWNHNKYDHCPQSKPSVMALSLVQTVSWERQIA